MNWLDKLERKLGRFAIPNLTVYLLAGYVIGFFIWRLMPDLMGWLTLEPALIVRGQVWRLVTWVLVSPTTRPIDLLFLVLLYYSLGTVLERTWGAFRYNVYIFSGMIFTVLGVFALYAVYFFGFHVEIPLSMAGMVSTNYITMSIFLAFAAIYPDMEVYLMFILPIKMKWMALVYAAMALYYLLPGGVVSRVAIAASLLNFVIFFLSSRNMKRIFLRRRGCARQNLNGSQPLICSIPTGRNTAVQCAGGRSLTIRAWSSVSARNATGITNTARTICSRTSM